MVCLVGFFVVLGEMGDVFWVDEVFLASIYVQPPSDHAGNPTNSDEHTLIMILLKMMDLVLILIIPMMARSQLRFQISTILSDDLISDRNHLPQNPATSSPPPHSASTHPS